jgi:hypothetical protein
MSPTGQELPKGPPDQRQRPGCRKKVPAHGRGARPWKENNVKLAGLEGYEED